MPITFYAKLCGHYFIGNEYYFYMFYPRLQFPGTFLKHPVYAIGEMFCSNDPNLIPHVLLAAGIEGFENAKSKLGIQVGLGANTTFFQ